MKTYGEKMLPILEDLENPDIELAGGSTVGMILSITDSLLIYICNKTIGKKKYEYYTRAKKSDKKSAFA